MGFEVVESSVLKVYKVPIQELFGFADHYYLAENANLHNSVGWGPSGLELRGLVKITPQELERVERFMSVAKYSISINNCEHFANYVLSVLLPSQFSSDHSITDSLELVQTLESPHHTIFN